MFVVTDRGVPTNRVHAFPSNTSGLPLRSEHHGPSTEAADADSTWRNPAPEFMQPLGISINALARALAVPPNRISGIVNGTRAITGNTALRLGRYFGTSPELWLELQSDYELRIARQTNGEAIESQVSKRVAQAVAASGLA